MKKIIIILCAGMLVSAFCTGCNDKGNDKKLQGLGENIPGVEIKQATGTVIGAYSNGFFTILVQVDEEYPIGDTFEFVEGPSDCISLSTGTYPNVIEVQRLSTLGRGRQISFSFREFQMEKDRDLFITPGSGIGYPYCASPNVPRYTITELNF